MAPGDAAAAEMIGAILLTVIIGSAIAIVGYQWISQVPTASMPYASLEIACGNASASPDNPEMTYDYSCRSGIVSCEDETYEQCIANIPKEFRNGTEQYTHRFDLCQKDRNCVNPKVYESCNMVYLCHTGGDPLLVRNIWLVINNKKQGGITPGMVYHYDATSTASMEPNDYFEPGEVIRYPLNGADVPLESVTIGYRDLRTGQNISLWNKQFIGR
jgi:hypothetical protein